MAAGVLNLCGINVGVYHRFLTTTQRERLIYDFNENPDGIQCMVSDSTCQRVLANLARVCVLANLIL